MKIEIIKKAKALGASLAGLTEVDLLKDAPSYATFDSIALPLEAKSVLVLALEHSEIKPPTTVFLLFRLQCPISPERDVFDNKRRS